jgi:hypothetical protein
LLLLLLLKDVISRPLRLKEISFLRLGLEKIISGGRRLENIRPGIGLRLENIGPCIRRLRLKNIRPYIGLRFKYVWPWVFLSLETILSIVGQRLENIRLCNGLRLENIRPSLRLENIWPCIRL